METRLKTVRQARGWSQSRLVSELERVGEARKVAVASRASLKTAVSRWENGHVNPDPVYSALLAEIYETSPSDLGLEPGPSILWVPPTVTETRVSFDYLDAMAQLLDGYARADNVAGSGHLLGVITQHIGQLERAALEARNGLREATFSACSRFAEFAGWLCQDAGDLHEAEHWTQRALDYLEVLDDQLWRAYVLMRKAAVAADRKEHSRSVSLALAAEQTSSGLTPQVQSLVLRQAAISHALADDAVASERAVERALDRVDGLLDPDSPFAYCTPSYVLMEVGVAAARQRQYDVAADRFASALTGWPAGFERDHGLCLARAALVDAARGNVEGACDLGKQALSVAAVVNSARTRAVLQSLDRRLARHAGATVVEEFRSYSGELG